MVHFAVDVVCIFGIPPYIVRRFGGKRRKKRET
jgi:hypothetical protein